MKEVGTSNIGMPPFLGSSKIDDFLLIFDKWLIWHPKNFRSFYKVKRDEKKDKKPPHLPSPYGPFIDRVSSMSFFYRKISYLFTNS